MHGHVSGTFAMLQSAYSQLGGSHVTVEVKVLITVPVGVVVLERVVVVYTVDVSVVVVELREVLVDVRQKHGQAAKLVLSEQSRYWQKSGSVSQISSVVVVSAIAAAISSAQVQGQTFWVEVWVQSTAWVEQKASSHVLVVVMLVAVMSVAVVEVLRLVVVVVTVTVEHSQGHASTDCA